MTGDFVSQTGSWLQRVAVGWLTWELTGSATWLGVIAFMDLAPALVVSPIAGAYADRMDRLRFIKLTINLTLLQPVALAVLFYSGAMNIWWLFALSLYHGVINAASLPARLAIVPSLVPRTDLSSAIALNSVIFNLSRFTGPAAAGVIITTAGVGMAFVVNALTFFAFALTLAMLSIATEPAGEAKKHILADVAQGFRYMVSHPGIGPLMMLLITSAILARPFIDLLPGFAADVFGRGAEALAWMVSVTGLGAGCGALWLAMRDSIKGLTVIAVSFVLVAGLGLLVFTATDIFWVALPALFVTGSGIAVSAIGVLTLVQSAVAPNMRGRVVSLYGIVFRGGPAFGALAMGWIASEVGLRPPVAGGAALCIVAWAWAIRRLEFIALSLEQLPDGDPRGADKPVNQA
jgi:predicted MFS family arabinose efflux permease